MVLRFILLSLLGMLSCSFFRPEVEDFTFSRQPYTGNEIRLDGYFYRGMYSQEEQDSAYTLYFFNRNGVVQNISSYSTLSEIERRIRSGENDLSNKRYSWGVFKIENGQIIQETWKPEGGFFIAGYKYEIKSDTTFEVIELYGRDFEEEVGYVYKFKEFSPKPDSVTKFID